MKTLALIAVLAAPAAAQWLHVPDTYPTGDVPRQVAEGDLDGDGLTDLVVLDGGAFPVTAARLTVLGGAGDGTLGSSITFPIIDNTYAFGLADITGDGTLDVVTSNPVFLEVAVYPGNGQGGLLPATAVPLGAHAVELALGDLDLDGDADAVVSTGVDMGLRVLLGGGGTLAPAGTLALSASTGRISIARLDADALPDVLVQLAGGTGGYSLKWLPGLGGGALGAPQAAFDNFHEDHALADLDGDDDLDLVMCGGNFIETGANDGQGVFTPQLVQQAGSLLTGVVAADLDLDGAVDIVGGSDGDSTLRPLLGDGAGGFSPGPAVLVPGGTGSMLATDLSGDGRPDVCAVSPTQDVLYVARANDARLRLQPVSTLPSGNAPRDVALGDLNGDGHLDAVLLSTNLFLLWRTLGDGAGGFGTKKGFGPDSESTAVDLGDFDADGAVDAALVDGSSDTLWLYRGDGAGNFVQPHPTTVQDDPAQVLLRDFDGDGLLDALVGGLTVAAVQVLPGDGKGGVGSPVSSALPAPGRLGVGDLDGDLDVDLVTVHAPTLDVIAWRNAGDGSFAAPTTLRTGYSGCVPVLADFDADGRLDVAAALNIDGYLGSSVALLRGDGAGGLQPPAFVRAAPAMHAVAADLDGDGRPDYVSQCEAKDVNPGGSGSFEQVQVLTAGGGDGLRPGSVSVEASGLESLAAGDVDGDGRVDVVHVAGNPDKLMRVALNASAPHPWHDLGSALAGSFGAPALAAASWAEVGTPGSLRLSSAAPLALAVLFISPVSTPGAFKGGVLVPVPPALSLPLATDAHGALALAWAAWPPLGPGDDWFFQAAVADAGAVKGVALSNALKLVQP